MEVGAVPDEVSLMMVELSHAETKPPFERNTLFLNE
jgi:hypothetical protein